jgi:hypothetical protein
MFWLPIKLYKQYLLDNKSIETTSLELEFLSLGILQWKCL